MINTCPITEFHTAHLTVWGHIAYGTPLPLWRVIPHRWLTRPCPGSDDFPTQTWAAS